MSTTWAAENLAKIGARRSLPESIRLPEFSAFAKWLSKEWAARAFYEKRKWGQLFEAGAESTLEAAFAAPRADAVALLQALSLPALKKAKLETLAFAERIVREMAHGRVAAHPERSLTPFIAGERGLADAVNVHLRACELHLVRSMKKSELWALVLSVAKEPAATKCDELRHAVAAASNEDYARSVAVAAKARARMALEQRAALAFHFPDQPWGTEDLEVWLADPAFALNHVDVSFLLSATNDSELVRRFVVDRHRAWSAAGCAYDLAFVLPEADALGILGDALGWLLKKPSYGPVLKGPPREIAGGIAAIGTPAAAAILAKHAQHPILAPQILAWFRENPALTGALGEAAADGSKLAATADRIAKKQKGASTAAAVASPGDLPTVLRDTPWRTKSKAKPTVIHRLAMKGLELERVDAELLETEPYRRADSEVRTSRPMTTDELAKWRAEVKAGGFNYADYEILHHRGAGYEYLEVPAADGLAAWNSETKDGKGKTVYLHIHEPEFAFLVKHGPAAFPGWIRRDWAKYLGWEGGESTLLTSLVVVSPRMAPAMAEVFEYRKPFRRHARAWLVKHSDVAALGLVPDAVGPLGRPRTAAESALTMLAGAGKRAAVESAASAYGKKARETIDALLARDPLVTDQKPPKRPPILRLGDLPSIELRSGETLGPDAIDGVLDMLSISLPEEAYAGIALLREACTEDSLGAFALELLEQWVLGDAPGRHDWMGFAVVHLPSEAGHARLFGLAREWATKNQAKAERACIALTSIGTDAALLHLTHIAERTRFATLKDRAAALVKQAANARGLSIEELEDRTVPVLDADADKKTRDAVLQRVTRRLERLMLSGRAIERGALDAFFLKHPVVAPLCRALVWESADGTRSFRVAEDGSFADARDHSVALEDTARVRLAHPARTAGLGEAWSTVFGDYELIQPFEQLGRVVARPTAKETKATELERGAGVTVAAKKLLGVLEACGWRRDSAGQPSAFLRELAGVTAHLQIEPGFEIQYLADAEPQKLGTVTFSTTDGPVALGAVDAVAFSEAVRDLGALR